MNVNGKHTDNECPTESETTNTESFVEVMSAPLDGFQNLGISSRQSWRKLSLSSKEKLDVVRTMQIVRNMPCVVVPDPSCRYKFHKEGQRVDTALSVLKRASCQT